VALPEKSSAPVKKLIASPRRIPRLAGNVTSGIGRCVKRTPSNRRLAISAPPVTRVKPSRWIALSDAVSVDDSATYLAMLVVSIHANNALIADWSCIIVLRRVAG
jgi:hypothetical protein